MFCLHPESPENMMKTVLFSKGANGSHFCIDKKVHIFEGNTEEKNNPCFGFAWFSWMYSTEYEVGYCDGLCEKVWRAEEQPKTLKFMNVNLKRPVSLFLKKPRSFKAVLWEHTEQTLSLLNPRCDRSFKSAMWEDGED